jgi:class 3 adenylate cyclase
LAKVASANKSDASPIRVADALAAETLGERKTVTALFADIKGSTELIERLDPEEARAIIDPVLRLMMDAVHRYGGYIAQSTGDGIFALFGTPVAHDDLPQRALYAALRMQEELRRYSAKLVAEGGNPLQCRVGVNTGEVVVRSISTRGAKTEYTPIGHTTNLASRTQAVAPVGSIALRTLRSIAVSPARAPPFDSPRFTLRLTVIGPRILGVRGARQLRAVCIPRRTERSETLKARELANKGRCVRNWAICSR